jgi:hypothetical protein
MCRANLQGWQIPAVIRFVNDLDLGASGKIARNLQNHG